MEITIEKSLAELMEEAFYLSLNIVYETLSPNGHYFDERENFHNLPESILDTVFGWADGLCHGMYQRISTGRCPTQTTIDFDIGDWETTVKVNIRMMKEALKMLGMPRKMTYDEMWV